MTAMVWNRWGAPEGKKELSPEIRTLLKSVLGISGDVYEPIAPEDVQLRVSTLDSSHLSGLAGIVGSEHVTTDHHARLLHAGGKSTLDLLRRRSVGTQDAPDAVVSPADHSEVVAVLQYCASAGIAVVPFGGGTSVVGGVQPNRGAFTAVVTLDLGRLVAVGTVDEVSATVTLGAGLSGPDAEAKLAEQGWSIGHLPQSFQFASIGGFAATRSSGQASAGYGRFDDMVQALKVATPRGTLDLGRAPKSAAGPDLRELFVGSEGAFGVITEVTIRVHPVPETTHYAAWSFPNFEAGAAGLRAVRQAGVAPTVMRLSDEAETGVNLAGKIGSAPAVSGCLAITTFEGSADHVATRAAEAASLLTAAGGTSLGAEPAQTWEHGRYNAPYMRDSLLDCGVLCETLETATPWSNLSTLRAAVTGALTKSLADQGTPPLVLCHISHTYPTGASLYFTVICKQADDPLEQWLEAKAAATTAMTTSGGTITHHHAVGTDHQPWMNKEVTELGVEVLRAVKSVLDPAGILNPGKLVG